MRIFCPVLLVVLSPLIAEPIVFTIEEPGFAEIVTTSFTKGQICRKIDTVDAPFAMPWHLKPSGNSVYFAENEDAPMPFARETEINRHCQTQIRRSALVGPLTPGSWKGYGASKGKLSRLIKTKGKTAITQQNGVFSFEISQRAILHARAGRYHNSTGACFVYAQLLAKRESVADHTRLVIYIPFSGKTNEKDGVKCRALPQTVDETAFVLEAGKYEATGPHLREVSIYETASSNEEER